MRAVFQFAVDVDRFRAEIDVARQVRGPQAGDLFGLFENVDRDHRLAPAFASITFSQRA